MPASAFQRMPLTVTLMASPFMYTLQCPVWSVQGILWVLNLWKLLIKCQGAWAIQYCLYALFRARSKCVCCIYHLCMYKSLKVEYVHKHTTLGIDKNVQIQGGASLASLAIHNPCRSQFITFKRLCMHCTHCTIPHL